MGRYFVGTYTVFLLKLWPILYSLVGYNCCNFCCFLIVLFLNFFYISSLISFVLFYSVICICSYLWVTFIWFFVLSLSFRLSPLWLLWFPLGWLYPFVWHFITFWHQKTHSGFLYLHYLIPGINHFLKEPHDVNY